MVTKERRRKKEIGNKDNELGRKLNIHGAGHLIIIPGRFLLPSLFHCDIKRRDKEDLSARYTHACIQLFG